MDNDTLLKKWAPIFANVKDTLTNESKLYLAGVLEKLRSQSDEIQKSIQKQVVLSPNEEFIVANSDGKTRLVVKSDENGKFVEIHQHLDWVNN